MSTHLEEDVGLEKQTPELILKNVCFTNKSAFLFYILMLKLIHEDLKILIS